MPPATAFQFRKPGANGWIERLGKCRLCGNRVHRHCDRNDFGGQSPGNQFMGLREVLSGKIAMRPIGIAIAFCLLAGLFWAVILAGAQAPVGPMTQTTAPPPAENTAAAIPSPAKTTPVPDVPRKKDLTGSWKLNKDESTQPKKRNNDSSDNGGGRRGGGGLGRRLARRRRARWLWWRDASRRRNE